LYEHDDPLRVVCVNEKIILCRFYIYRIYYFYWRQIVYKRSINWSFLSIIMYKYTRTKGRDDIVMWTKTCGKSVPSCNVLINLTACSSVQGTLKYHERWEDYIGRWCGMNERVQYKVGTRVLMNDLFFLSYIQWEIKEHSKMCSVLFFRTPSSKNHLQQQQRRCGLLCAVAARRWGLRTTVWPLESVSDSFILTFHKHKTHTLAHTGDSGRGPARTRFGRISYYIILLLLFASEFLRDKYSPIYTSSLREPGHLFAGTAPPSVK